MTIEAQDMSRFTSRLNYRGTLTFDTAHRIGVGTSFDVTAPNLPVLRTVDGLPYIPGSSFKGAWRSYTEAVLRTIQAQPNVDRPLSCNPIIDDTSDGAKHIDAPIDITQYRCVPNWKIKALKDEYNRDEQQATLDSELRKASCLTCRVFGNHVIASKALTRDLPIMEETFLRTQIRDGVAIDRDAARAADGMKYTVEVVPAGAAFDLQIVIENGAEAELGLALIGLKAFERGEIQLGGGRSRGLGWCHIEPRWDESEYITETNLLAHLLGGETGHVTAETSAQTWLSAFAEYVEGQRDA